MKNTSNQNKQEENCPICDSYDQFKFLIKESVSVEDAFHDTFAELAEKLIEDLSETIYDNANADGHFSGYKEGFAAALREVAKQAENTADSLEEQFDNEACTCGSEDCPDSFNSEVNVDCGNCNCEDACEIEKKIRRAVWEDM